LDDLANSLVVGTEPKRLSDLSILLERLENMMPSVFSEMQNATQSRQSTMTGASLFYHLKNAVDLTLATRELISRLLRSTVLRPSAEIGKSSPE
jgi:hypothetical protein